MNEDLELQHCERLSSHPDVLRFAQQINTSFLKEHLTELPKLDTEYEAVLLREPISRKIQAIIVFYKYDEHDRKPTYYLVIVWTTKQKRGHGCYGRMLEWMRTYAKKKNIKRLSTDVHWDNERMIRLKEKHWGKTFVRFNLEL